MSKCSVCEQEKARGLKVDTSRSKRAWAAELGVSEASVRRHVRHHADQDAVAAVPSTVPYRETWKGNQGEVSVTLEGEDLSPEAILRKFGHDPEKVRIVDALAESHWQVGEQWRHSYRFKTERRSASEDLNLVKDLPLLYQEITSRPPKRETMAEQTRAANQARALVVIWADIQVGKTGSRGGTPELIERITGKREALRQYMADHPSTEAYFLSVGDEVESFENTPQQAFTNDLSFPDQLDLELTLEMSMISAIREFNEKVTVAGVSSNHCRWRAGKNALGAPKDDYGIFIKRQLEKFLGLSDRFSGVSFKYPETWDETLAVDVLGTRIGLAHGHQVNNPNGIEAWWTKQAFGAQATAEADVLVTGHFHTFRAQPMGRSIKTGRNRWWLQAPTLDNGSDWFRNLQGSDSDAGLLVFQVTEAGLDLQSLTIL